MSLSYGKEYADAPPWQVDPEGVPPPRRAWQRVDLGPVLEGTYQPLLPTVGLRSDGVAVLYRGRVHSLASESEGGKTWLALLLAGDELRVGHRVVYIDHESDEAEVVGRLRALGVDPGTLAKGFAYLRPDGPLDLVAQADLEQILAGRPELVIVDGVTESMVLLGLDPLANKDAALFSAALPRRLARCGAAVLLLDHVPKDPEQRGRYAIGAVHKLNALDGAQLLLENRQPFTIGTTGRSTLLVSKDRGGQLRRLGLPTRERMVWFADLVIASHDATFVEASLDAPDGSAPTKRPTVLMGRVYEALLRSPEPLTKQDLLDRVQGKTAAVRSAIAALIDEGVIAVETGYRGARLHRIVKDFLEDS